MESVLKVGRTMGDGVWRAAGALAWGTRRILASIPLLGISGVAREPPDTEPSISNITGGEEAENATAAASSPVDKSEVSSPVESEAAPVQATEAKEIEKSAASPADEKKEEATPVVEKEKLAEKIEATVAEKVEVSAGARPSTGQQFVEVIASHTEPIAMPSIIERKTSEDLPSQFPSSPPPTPIDPSPLQQAQQAAASATALAEALKLPAEAAASKETPISLSSSLSFDEHTTEFINESVTPLESQSKIESLKNISKQDLTESKIVQELSKQVQELPKKIQETVEVSECLKKIDETLEVQESTKKIETLQVQESLKKIDDTLEVQESLKKIEETLEVQESPKKIQETTEVQKILEEIQETPKKINEILEAQNETPKADQEIPKEVKEFSKNAEQIELESLEEDLVIQTEEGPIPFRDSSSDIETIQVEPMDLDTPQCTKEFTESSIHHPQNPSSDVETIQVEPTESILRKTNENEDIPPPLPESPAPVTQEAFKILNFVNAEIPPIAPLELSDSVQESTSCPLPVTKSEQIMKEILPESLVEISTDLKSSITDILETPACAQVDDARSNDVSDSLDDLPPVPQELPTCEEDSSEYPLPPDDLSLQSLPDENQESRIPLESLLTPPRSPSPASVSFTMSATTRECSETQLCDDQSNHEFKVESVSQSLKSYNDSEPETKERLADSESLTSQLTNGHIIIEDHQSIPEQEAPVENNVSANEISTTESTDEAPKSPPPAVPVEVSVSPAPAPVITEDVASVTKVIEEIDISEKAVAAAVKEAIENSNANEIVVDSNHQNHMNE